MISLPKRNRKRIKKERGIFQFDGSNDFYIEYWIGDKRRQKKVGPSLALARQIRIERLADLSQGRPVDDKPDRILFKDFAEDYKDIHASTLKSCSRVCLSVKWLNEYFGDMYLDQITKLEVEKFKKKRALKVKRSTTNRDLAILKNMFNKAIAWEKAQRNPVIGVKLFNEEEFKRTEYLTAEEMGRLLDECRKSKNKDLYPIVLTALHTGMRRGEIFDLNIDDMDFDNRLVRVRKSKSGRQRQIPMTSLLAETLQDVVKRRKANKIRSLEKLVFPGAAGRRLTGVSKAFEAARSRAGIVNFRFHGLRHTFATNQRLAGTDLTDLKDLLGHADLTMTLRYAHVTPRHTRKVMDQFEAFLAADLESACNQ